MKIILKWSARHQNYSNLLPKQIYWCRFAVFSPYWPIVQPAVPKVRGGKKAGGLSYCQGASMVLPAGRGTGLYCEPTMLSTVARNPVSSSPPPLWLCCVTMPIAQNVLQVAQASSCIYLNFSVKKVVAQIIVMFQTSITYPSFYLRTVVRLQCPFNNKACMLSCRNSRLHAQYNQHSWKWTFTFHLPVWSKWRLAGNVSSLAGCSHMRRAGTVHTKRASSRKHYFVAVSLCFVTLDTSATKDGVIQWWFRYGSNIF